MKNKKKTSENCVTEKPKKKIKFLFVKLFLLILFVASVFCYLCKPVYYRLYPGNRVHGNIKVMIDGQPAELDDEKISAISTGENFRSEVDGNRAEISMKANTYGGHYFVIKIPDFKPTIIPCAYQHNWWSVMDFDMNIDIDTSTSTITYDVTYTYIKDNGGSETNNFTRTKQYSDDNIEFTFGM